MKQHIIFRLFATLLLVCACLPLLGVTIHPLPDINGSGATVQVSTSIARVYWLQVIPDSNNMNPVLFGDSTTSSSIGLPLAAGSGYLTPIISGQTYPLNQFYVYVSMGDKVHFSYAQ